MTGELIGTTLLLLGGGVLAGIINTMAGGGSLLTIPILIFAGLPATDANGTNRIFMLIQSAASAREMHRRAPFPARATLWATLPTLLGALLGAWLAVGIDATQMRTVIGGALLVALTFTLLSPRTFLKDDAAPAPLSAGRQTLFMFAMFAMGIYGGFIQAGLGAIIPLAMVALGRWRLLPAAGAKNVIIALYTLPVLGIFLYHGQVQWLPGMTLAVGALLGAKLGALFAHRGGQKVVLAFLILVTLAAALQLIFAE